MRQWPMSLQIVVFAALLAGSVGVWVQREQVSKAFAALRDSGGEEGTSRRGRGRGSGDDAIPVIVAEVTRRQNVETLTVIGTGRAKRAVTVTTLADGRITKLPARAGTRVTAGTVLVEIDNTQAALELEIARKKLADAQRLQDRTNYLASRRVNSAARTEDADSAVAQAQLEVRKAQKTLNDLSVVAPFDGVVGIAQAEVGDRVTASTPILTLDDRSVIEIEFDVPERFLSRLKVGGAVEVTTPSYPQRTFDGEIAEIDSRLNAENRTVRVRAAVPNTDDALRAGMSFSVNATFRGDTYAAVPELALQWRGGDSYIWLVKDRVAKRTDVRAIRRVDQMVLVSGPVEAGDLVVIEGVQRLRPDRAVSFETAADKGTARQRPRRDASLRQPRRSTGGPRP